MRVIAGKYKKSNLVTVKGNNTRPTTDYIKEVIYSVLPDCEDFEVLDLYAGSGGLGIEALSRGAKFADFVDASEKAIKVIHQNINKLRCNDNVKIHKKRVSSFIKGCEKVYDLILMDPPYNKGLISKTLEQLELSKIFHNSILMLIEHSPKEAIPSKWNPYIDFHKKYGETQLTVLRIEGLKEKHETL